MGRGIVQSGNGREVVAYEIGKGSENGNEKGIKLRMGMVAEQNILCAVNWLVYCCSQLPVQWSAYQVAEHSCLFTGDSRHRRC